MIETWGGSSLDWHPLNLIWRLFQNRLTLQIVIFYVSFRLQWRNYYFTHALPSLRYIENKIAFLISAYKKSIFWCFIYCLLQKKWENQWYPISSWKMKWCAPECRQSRQCAWFLKPSNYWIWKRIGNVRITLSVTWVSIYHVKLMISTYVPRLLQFPTTFESTHHSTAKWDQFLILLTYIQCNEERRTYKEVAQLRHVVFWFQRCFCVIWGKMCTNLCTYLIWL